MELSKLTDLLEFHYDKYNHPGFVENDPISIPHSFDSIQDKEIMGFFSAILAWGQRITTINKCKELAMLMDNAPHEFICTHQPSDLKRLESFKHRTFNGTDLLYFISFFKHFYKHHISLEEAFLFGTDPADPDMKDAIAGFHQLFFSLDHVPARTHKHIANSRKNSACKRINMYLRWMVRNDGRGVDLGIWNNIPTSALMCPLDVHVERTSRSLGLLERKQRDWRSVEELTANLRKIDPQDPVRFDFALFGMSLEGVTID